MQRFVLRENIKRFQRSLTQEQDPAACMALQALLTAAKRDLAVLDASDVGAAPFGAVRGPADRLARRDRRLLSLLEDSGENYLFVDPGPGLRIIDCNNAYSVATMIDRGKVAGERVFDVFPDNPDDALADGVSNLFRSFQIVVETGRAHEMALQRYDVRDPSGRFVTRYWRPLNTPLFSEAGDLVHILHQAIQVTQEAEARP